MTRSLFSLVVLVVAALVVYHLFGPTLTSIWHDVWTGTSAELHHVHQLLHQGTTGSARPWGASSDSWSRTGVPLHS